MEVTFGKILKMDCHIIVGSSNDLEKLAKYIKETKDLYSLSVENIIPFTNGKSKLRIFCPEDVSELLETLLNDFIFKN